MSILQGTPISTQGVHPLVSIMAQGGDILSRGFQGAAQQQARNTNLTMSFLQDAARERINRQQQDLEERKMVLSAQQHQSDMEQRERMQATDIAARERMAAQRTASMGSRSGRGGGSGSGDSDAELAQFNAMVGSLFQQAGCPQQPQQQAPQASAAGVPGFGGMEADLGAMNADPKVRSFMKDLDDTANQASTSVYQASRKDLSVPENANGVLDAIDFQMKANLLGVAASQTVSGKISQLGYYASAGVTKAKLLEEQQKGSKGDLNGIAVIENAVAESLNWKDGFTGKKGSIDEDLELAMQDPVKGEAITLMAIPSEKLAMDLRNKPVDLEKNGALLDVYTTAAAVIQRQEDDAVFRMAQNVGKDGSVVDGRAPVRSRFAEDPTVQAVRGHQKVFSDAFNAGIKDADLSNLPKSVLLRLEPTADLNVSKAQEAFKSAESWEQRAREEVQQLLGPVDDKGTMPGMWHLDQEINKVYNDTASRSDQSERYNELSRYRSSWGAAKKKVQETKNALDENWSALNRIHVRLGRADVYQDQRDAREATDANDKIGSAEIGINMVVDSLQGFTHSPESFEKPGMVADEAIRWAESKGLTDVVVELKKRKARYIEAESEFNESFDNLQRGLPAGGGSTTSDPTIESQRDDAFDEHRRRRVGNLDTVWPSGQ